MKQLLTFENDIVTLFSDIEQHSPEWFELRRGIPCASDFGGMIAGGEGKMRRSMLYRLAGEILSGKVSETYSNGAMARGREMEDAAVLHYEFTRGVSTERIGFVRRTVKSPLGLDFEVGCSPDRFVGSDGVLEVKTTRPDLMIEMIESKRFPTEHVAQVQGVLWVTGRLWCDLKIFYDGMPVSPTFRINRDETYIRDLNTKAEIFSHDLRNLVTRIGGKR